MKYNKFNRPACRSLREDLEKVLQSYGVDANIDFKVGNMRFSESEVKITVEGKISGVKTVTDSIFESMARQHNLTTEAVYKGGDEYQLTGYSSRRPKYPWSFTKNGRPYKGSDFHVLWAKKEENRPTV